MIEKTGSRETKQINDFGSLVEIRQENSFSP